MKFIVYFYFSDDENENYAYKLGFFTDILEIIGLFSILT